MNEWSINQTPMKLTILNYLKNLISIISISLFSIVYFNSIEFEVENYSIEHSINHDVSDILEMIDVSEMYETIIELTQEENIIESVKKWLKNLTSFVASFCNLFIKNKESD